MAEKQKLVGRKRRVVREAVERPAALRAPSETWLLRTLVELRRAKEHDVPGGPGRRPDRAERSAS